MWEDEASFQAFSEHLMPLLAEHGVQLGRAPVVGQIERIKVGEPVAAA